MPSSNHHPNRSDDDSVSEDGNEKINGIGNGNGNGSRVYSLEKIQCCPTFCTAHPDYASMFCCDVDADMNMTHEEEEEEEDEEDVMELLDDDDDDDNEDDEEEDDDDDDDVSETASSTLSSTETKKNSNSISEEDPNNVDVVIDVDADGDEYDGGGGHHRDGNGKESLSRGEKVQVQSDQEEAEILIGSRDKEQDDDGGGGGGGEEEEEIGETMKMNDGMWMEHKEEKNHGKQISEEEEDIVILDEHEGRIKENKNDIVLRNEEIIDGNDDDDDDDEDDLLMTTARTRPVRKKCKIPPPPQDQKKHTSSSSGNGDRDMENDGGVGMTVTATMTDGGQRKSYICSSSDSNQEDDCGEGADENENENGNGNENENRPLCGGNYKLPQAPPDDEDERVAIEIENERVVAGIANEAQGECETQGEGQCNKKNRMTSQKPYLCGSESSQGDYTKPVCNAKKSQSHRETQGGKKEQNGGTRTKRKSYLFGSDSEEDTDSDWNGSNEGDDIAWAKEASLYDMVADEKESEKEDDIDSFVGDPDDGSDAGLHGGEEWWISTKGNGRKRKRGALPVHSRTSLPKEHLVRADMEPLPKLSRVEMKKALEAITHKDKPLMALINRFLQCTLWDLDFRYTLLSHQFIGAFGVAGVSIPALYKNLEGMDQTTRKLLVELGPKGKEYRCSVCASAEFVKSKGLLLADDMGLGKTIQSLAGAIFRQRIQFLKSALQSVRGEKNINEYLPTLIVSPNKEVLDQWEETLLRGGTPASKIKFFHPLQQFGKMGDTSVLITRHQLMAEFRRVLNYEQSNLFPTVQKNLLKILENQYKAGQGKAKNLYREDETDSECVTRMLNKYKRHFPRPTFRSMLIDEAHFLKNLLSYWGMGTAFLGLISERIVPLSGTPYNNGPQDMATLMTFIDPSLGSAKSYWWENATDTNRENTNTGYVAKQVARWRTDYMIRRDKSVLDVKLPTKETEIHAVAVLPTELQVYEYYEATFLKTLREFSHLMDANNPEEKLRQKNLFIVIMATMSCMRMCLIHPLLPGGREYTMRFSPTRRNNRKLLSQIAKENSSTCVCCQLHLTAKAKQATIVTKTEPLTEEEIAALQNIGAVTEDEDMQDADFDGAGNRNKKKNEQKKKEKHLGSIIPLPSEYCRAIDGCKHYIHEECLKEVRTQHDQWTCPRCEDLETRVKIVADLDTDRPIYCKHVVCGTETGIRASAKIHDIVEWARAIPSGDKAIVYSFFKGGLDLLEGIFAEDLGIECARFDGDVGTEERSEELARFKTSTSCRILLATVQSSGVGLNIVEANHVAFLDRWFNPCVHAQAEDRCHRLKQTKDVKVTYFDTSMTVDEVMAYINAVKKNNATVLLADGSDIGVGQSGIKYRDLSGMIGSMMRTINDNRLVFRSLYPGRACQPVNMDELNSTMSSKESQSQSCHRLNFDNVEDDDCDGDIGTRNLSPLRHESYFSNNDMQQNLLRTARSTNQQPAPMSQSLPRTHHASVRTIREYEARIPVTADGLLLKLDKNERGRTQFTGYRKKPDGSKGHSEVKNLVRNIGDTIQSIEDDDTRNMKFDDVVSLLKNLLTQERSHIRMVFRSCTFPERRFRNLDASIEDIEEDDIEDSEMKNPTCSSPIIISPDAVSTRTVSRFKPGPLEHLNGMGDMNGSGDSMIDLTK